MLRQAWELDDADKAEKLIRNLAQRLEFKRTWRAAVRAKRKHNDRTVARCEAELPELYVQIEQAIPASLAGAAFKLRASAELAKAEGDPTAEHIAEIASRVHHGRLRPYDIRQRCAVWALLCARRRRALFGGRVHGDHVAMAHPAALGLVGRIALEARRAVSRRAFCFGDALTIKDRRLRLPEEPQVL